MELGQAEPLRVLDHHHRGVWNVDPHLNHRSGHKHMNAACGEILHQLVFLPGLHLSMEIFHPDPGRQILAESFRVVYDIFRLDHLAGLHHRADHVGLAACLHLPLNKPIGVLSVICPHHTVFDRLSVSRKLINHRNIQIAVENNGKSSGNGRGAHDQYMRLLSLLPQHLPLADAEAVLLVCNDKSQLVIDHLLLNQSMGSHDNIRLVVFYLPIGQALLLCRHGSRQ